MSEAGLDHKRIAAANPKACAACPWRLANQGKPHPHGWYRASNLVRLWSKLKHGESMSCHPTDPRNEVPEGCKPVPQDATTHECTGALTLQQREVMNFQAIAQDETLNGKTVMRAYKAAHPHGMSRQGLAAIVSRDLFRGLGGVPMAKPDLNDTGVGYSKLGWKP